MVISINGPRMRSSKACSILSPLIAAPLLLLGCQNANRAASRWTFYDLFSARAEIPLEYTDSSVVASVQVNISFCGERIVVGDAQGRQLLMFSKEGKFVRRIGRSGNAAGELGKPSRVCMTTNGRIFVYDQDHNSMLLYDTTANLLCSKPLRFGNIYQCGVSGESVITVGHAFYNETSAAAYYWRVCDTTRIGEFIGTYDYPKYLRMVIMSYQIPVLRNGEFCLLDEGTFRITKLSKEGEVLQVSDVQPSGFQGPVHDLQALNNEEAHMVAEKAHAILGFCYASRLLVVVWWDHQEFFMEIYDENLVPRVTRLAIPNTLYPFVYSDGDHLFFVERKREADKTSLLRNPTLVMFSISADKILPSKEPEQKE